MTDEAKLKSDEALLKEARALPLGDWWKPGSSEWQDKAYFQGTREELIQIGKQLYRKEEHSAGLL